VPLLSSEITRLSGAAALICRHGDHSLSRRTSTGRARESRFIAHDWTTFAAARCMAMRRSHYAVGGRIRNARDSRDDERRRLNTTRGGRGCRIR